MVHNGAMEKPEVEERTADAARALVAAGALFGYLHGSRARGSERTGSDIDIAAFFGADAPQSFEVLLPRGIDLLVLDQAPLEIAGRVATQGRLLFEDDAVARVRWESTTRKIFFDEAYRLRRAHDEFAESVRRGR